MHNIFTKNYASDHRYISVQATIQYFAHLLQKYISRNNPDLLSAGSIAINDEGVHRQAPLRGLDPAAHPGLPGELSQRLHSRPQAHGREVQEQDVGVSW